MGIFVRHFKFSSKTTAYLTAWLHAFCAHESAPAGWGGEDLAVLFHRKFINCLLKHCEMWNLWKAPPSPHSWILSSVSVGSSPRSYLFTSATGRKGVNTAPKYGTKPIRYVTLHVLDWRVAASRRHNRSCVWTIWWRLTHAQIALIRHKDTKYSISGFI